MRILGKPHSRSAGSGEAGFSLLELMVVLAILAVISASIVPVFGGAFGSVRQDNSVRNLVAAVQYASERAVADSTEYRLYLNVDENAYWVMRLGIDEEGERAFESIDDFKEREVLPEGLVLLEPKAYVDEDDVFFLSFYPNGAADIGEVLVQNERNEAVTHIETGGYLGRVVIREDS